MLDGDEPPLETWTLVTGTTEDAVYVLYASGVKYDEFDSIKVELMDSDGESILSSVDDIES